MNYPISEHRIYSVRELEEQNAEIEELASKYEVLLLRANDVAAENHRLTERVAELEAENAELLDDISAIRAAYTVQRNRASWHKERYENLEAEITRLTAERDRFLNERSTLAVELAFANDAIKWQLEPKVAELTAALVECQEAGENGVVTMRYCTKCGAGGVPLARKRGSKDWLCLDCDYEVYGPAIYEPENDREPEDDALQQAFDNGRDVGERSVGYGELG